MLLLTDPKSIAHSANLKQDVADLRSSVQSKSTVLQRHVSMPEQLRAARAADLERLQSNKRLVVDAVDLAYQQAEAALKDSYDKLDAKAC